MLNKGIDCQSSCCTAQCNLLSVVSTVVMHHWSESAHLYEHQCCKTVVEARGNYIFVSGDEE